MPLPLDAPYSQFFKLVEAVDAARDCAANACAVQGPAQPHYTQATDTLQHRQVPTHSAVSALRLPMVLGMVPLMPVLASPL